MFILITAAILRNEVGWFDEEENNSSLVAAHLAVDATDVKSAIAENIGHSAEHNCSYDFSRRGFSH
jgi:hypothetical protein